LPYYNTASAICQYFYSDFFAFSALFLMSLVLACGKLGVPPRASPHLLLKNSPVFPNARFYPYIILGEARTPRQVCGKSPPAFWGVKSANCAYFCRCTQKKDAFFEKFAEKFPKTPCKTKGNAV
jgi:hypothetical protein